MPWRAHRAAGHPDTGGTCSATACGRCYGCPERRWRTHARQLPERVIDDPLVARRSVWTESLSAARGIVAGSHYSDHVTDAEAPSTDAPHTTAGKLAELRSRLDTAIHAGNERAVEKQHAKGKMTARERIEYLLDDGSFMELDELAVHRSARFGMERNRPYTDGVVTGFGTVDGRQVCVFSQDVTLFGGAL